MSDALDQVRSQLATTTLARRFCSPEFTISQLREAYEAMWGTQLDAADFPAQGPGERRVPDAAQEVAEAGGVGWAARAGGGVGVGRMSRPFTQGWRGRG